MHPRRALAALLALLVVAALAAPAAADDVAPLEPDAPAAADEVAPLDAAPTDDPAPTEDAASTDEPAPVDEPAPAPPARPVITTGSGIDDSIARLYLAFFERAPDPSGLAFWVGRYRQGQRLDTIADAFTRSPEFTSTYGSLNSGAFVALVYRNVLGRQPDPTGYDYWAWKVERGELSRGRLMAQFSESREFVALTGTVAPQAPPAVVPAGSGEGRRIIYCVSCQQVWLVEDTGLLTRTYAVSGRANTPRAGTYSVFSKSPLAWAGYGGITMEYMVRYTWGNTMALGFHSIPKRPDGSFLQTEAELGQYRSAGCTRQRLADAKFLYDWAPVGTTVVVLR
ncbi:MAG TPA: DUF4214 domain-containing protein [Acidimicrobiales bacterium]|nr:DUF4214 domain-containing protein [Acidimicrobiales bacterium]